MRYRENDGRCRGTLARTCLAASITVAILQAGCGMPSSTASIATIHPAELSDRIDAGTTPLTVDVRRAEEFAEGHLPGAINIPHGEIGNRLAELGQDRAREIVIYCRSGRRAGLAEVVLLEEGFTGVRDLEGHFLGWKSAGRPVE